jgi:hypothetical protein
MRSPKVINLSVFHYEAPWLAETNKPTHLDLLRGTSSLELQSLKVEKSVCLSVCLSVLSLRRWATWELLERIAPPPH